jgi:hypothetical protein
MQECQNSVSPQHTVTCCNPYTWYFNANPCLFSSVMVTHFSTSFKFQEIVSVLHWIFLSRRSGNTLLTTYNISRRTNYYVLSRFVNDSLSVCCTQTEGMKTSLVHSYQSFLFWRYFAYTSFTLHACI